MGSATTRDRSDQQVRGWHLKYRMSPALEIVGRSSEMEAMGAFLDGSMPARALILRGDAGMGKTILWQHLVAGARVRGYGVVASQPTESEKRLSFAALGDLVSAVPDGAIDELPERQRTALDVALQRVAGVPAEQLAVSIAFVALLASSSSGAPVVVAMDDAQWIDAPSARVLEFALRRMAEHEVWFVMAVRSGELAPLADALLRAFPEPQTLTLDLGPLSVGALHHLFSSRLGQHFPRLTLVKLAQASGGNPLVALEIARALLESGEQLAPGAPLPVSRSLRQLLNRRIVRLPRATREALLVMAGSADPDAETIARALAIEDAELLLGPAEAAGVVEHDRGRVRFGHPLMASVVLGAVSPARLRELHGRLAAIATDHEQRARHLALSTDTANENVAAALEEAALYARRRGSPRGSRRADGTGAYPYPADRYGRPDAASSRGRRSKPRSRRLRGRAPPAGERCAGDAARRRPCARVAAPGDRPVVRRRDSRAEDRRRGARRCHRRRYPPGQDPYAPCTVRDEPGASDGAQRCRSPTHRPGRGSEPSRVRPIRFVLRSGPERKSRADGPVRACRVP